MKYWQLLERLKNLTEEQLHKEVLALIDLEPWKADDFKIGPKEDESFLDQPYFVFN